MNGNLVKSRFVILPLAILLLSTLLPAQILIMEEKNGKPVTCAMSGLRGWYTNCGADSFYSHIFLGTIRSVTPVKVGEFDEFRLVLEPEEIFRGDVPHPFVVTTSQGWCLPDLHPGDRWLFYIYTNDQHQPLIEFGHNSAPIDHAQDALARLRRLRTMSDSGMVMGTVSFGWIHPVDDEDRPSAAYVGREITLTSAKTGTQYQEWTDQEGSFTFGPLPAGEYQIKAHLLPGFWTDADGKFSVEAGDCKDFAFDMRAGGAISGHLRTPDGKPVGSTWVYLVSDEKEADQASSSAPGEAFCDEGGYYQFRAVPPGRYRVGMSSVNPAEASRSKLSLYAPGVNSIQKATIIDLANAEDRENIDFVIPDKLNSPPVFSPRSDPTQPNP